MYKKAIDLQYRTDALEANIDAFEQKLSHDVKHCWLRNKKGELESPLSYNDWIL